MDQTAFNGFSFINPKMDTILEKWDIPGQDPLNLPLSKSKKAYRSQEFNQCYTCYTFWMVQIDNGVFMSLLIKWSKLQIKRTSFNHVLYLLL